MAPSKAHRVGPATVPDWNRLALAESASNQRSADTGSSRDCLVSPQGESATARWIHRADRRAQSWVIHADQLARVLPGRGRPGRESR